MMIQLIRMSKNIKLRNIQEMISILIEYQNKLIQGEAMRTSQLFKLLHASCCKNE